MSRNQMRALVLAGVFVLVAMDWTNIGAALFLCLMQFIEG